MTDPEHPPDFRTTIQELTRLTRKGVLNWSVDHVPPTLADLSRAPLPQRLSTYRVECANMLFILEDAAPLPTTAADSNRPKGDPPPGSRYRLRILDYEDETTLSSPPMKSIRDLVSTIETTPRDKKLEDINERLSNI